MQKKLLFYFGCALIVGGALALAWYGRLQWVTSRTQRAQSRLLDDLKARGPDPSGGRSLPRALVILPPRPGELVGRIEIPRIHLSAMVLEGSSPKILGVAAGHIDGTALPGTPGNTAIAAHRDTFFRPLRDLRRSDEIRVTTPYGTFRYVVDAIEIVNPSNVQVLYPTADPQLTLVTCYPFTFVGPAPKRLIVHARQQA